MPVWWTWILLIPIIFVAVAPDIKIFYFVATMTVLTQKMATIAKELDKIQQDSYDKPSKFVWISFIQLIISL